MAGATTADRHRVVAAVLIRDSRVLLGYRHPGRRWLPSCWDVPGGHVEPGESGSEALRRELREELSIDVDIDRRADFRLVDDLYDCRFWVLRCWTGKITNNAPNEHTELRWFAAEDLPGLPLADPRYPEVITRALAESVGFPQRPIRGPLTKRLR